MQDKFSAQRVALLHPKGRQVFTDFINECEETFGITLRIVQGYRTIAYQDELYAQGRTKPGSIVTNARGGQSFHNFGLAVDLARMTDEDTVVDWNYDMAILKPIADKYKLSWGGTWVHIHDKPHFELNFGYPEDCKALLGLVKEGKVDKEGYVLLNVEVM